MQSLTRLSSLAALALAFVLPSPLFADEIGSIVNATDLFKVKEVHDPALSPDGKRIVYALKAIVSKPDGSYGYETNLWLVNSAGHAAAQALTHGPSGGSSPQWSPDGTKILFVRAVDHVPQLFILPIGEPGEAVQLTHLETGATGARWSPDGKSVCFVSDLSWDDVRRMDKLEDPPFPTERPGRAPNDNAVPPSTPDQPAPTPIKDASGSLGAIRQFLSEDEEAGNPRITTRLEFEGESDLQPTLDATHLYVIAAAGGKEEALTPGYLAFDQPAWMPDGTHLICIGPRDEAMNPDRDVWSDLYLVSVADHSRKHLGVAGYSVGEPQPSPDGKAVAFLATKDSDVFGGEAVVGVEYLDHKTPGRLLTAKQDRSAESPRWSKDGKYLYFIAPSNGGVPLFRVANNQQGIVERLNNYDASASSFDVGEEQIAVVRSKPTNPSELFATDLDGKDIHVLTTHNTEWLDNKLLSTPEHHVIDRPDGTKVDAWLMKPANFDGVTKSPLIVEIHGGPSAMWGPSEASTWFEFQYFTGRGYGIVYCNPRGSGGYGHAFQHANYRNWGPGPSADILAAADLGAAQTWVDPTRQVVTGGSYGGYMTAWIVTHDHRFKAAVAQRGVYDLVTFFGEGNAWRLVPEMFGGYPWEKEARAALEADSPFNYVDQCTTPLLIKHGDNDGRTGFVQSEMFYKALKVLGRPVEYVRYPRATHEMSRSGEPAQRLDRLVRYDEFFRRYVGDQ